MKKNITLHILMAMSMLLSRAYGMHKKNLVIVPEEQSASLAYYHALVDDSIRNTQQASALHDKLLQQTHSVVLDVSPVQNIIIELKSVMADSLKKQVEFGNARVIYHNNVFIISDVVDKAKQCVAAHQKYCEMVSDLEKTIQELELTDTFIIRRLDITKQKWIEAKSGIDKLIPSITKTSCLLNKSTFLVDKDMNQLRADFERAFSSMNTKFNTLSLLYQECKNKINTRSAKDNMPTLTILEQTLKEVVEECDKVKRRFARLDAYIGLFSEDSTCASEKSKKNKKNKKKSLAENQSISSVYREETKEKEDDVDVIFEQAKQNLAIIAESVSQEYNALVALFKTKNISQNMPLLLAMWDKKWNSMGDEVAAFNNESIETHEKRKLNLMTLTDLSKSFINRAPKLEKQLRAFRFEIDHQKKVIEGYVKAKEKEQALRKETEIIYTVAQELSLQHPRLPIIQALVYKSGVPFSDYYQQEQVQVLFKKAEEKNKTIAEFLKGYKN